MANVVPGRDTAQIDEPFVAFLIGMRVNKLTHLPPNSSIGGPGS
jgi:hypothetical protein